MTAFIKDVNLQHSPRLGMHWWSDGEGTGALAELSLMAVFGENGCIKERKMARSTLRRP